MALAEMQKVRVAVHESVLGELMPKIQELGSCHFIPQDEQDGLSIEGALSPVRSQLRSVDDLLGEVRFAMRFLDPFTTEKGSAVSRMMGDLPEYSISTLEKATSESAFRDLTLNLRSLEKKLSDARSGISRTRGLLLQLSALMAVPYPLELFNRGTEQVAGVLLSMKRDAFSGFKKELLEKMESSVECSDFFPGEKDADGICAVIFLKEDQAEFQSIADAYQAARMDVPEQFKTSSHEEYELLEAQLNELETQEKQIASEITVLAKESYSQSQLMLDYWMLHRAQLEALCDGEGTEQVVLLNLWLPVEALPAFKSALEPYENLCEMLLCEVADGETPPTLLQNHNWAEPLEPLTLMYGTPAYGGVDPTPLITPFFYLFFGMCFGDAGYGLILTGVLGYFLLRKRMTGVARKFFIIIASGGIASILMGVITGSYFGDSLDAFGFLSFLSPLKSLKLLDPMNDPMTLLGISLFLGMIQIFTGIIMAMHELWKKGDKLGAIADQGGWLVFLSGLVLVGLSSSGMLPVTMQGFSKIVAVAGALLLVLTQGRTRPSLAGKVFSGVFSLYNVTGYLGDVLSYSRLLALGLGSAAVGMVINLLAVLVTGVPYVGLLLGILVFVLGHLFSIAVNLLGAFVHSLRLQYVEFFGKFYETNGEDFIPLRRTTQYVRIAADRAAS